MLWASKYMAARQAASTTEVRVGTNVFGWMFFLGLLLLLMGAYGAFRIVHVTKRGVPYPSTGVMPANLLFDRSPIYYIRETDCQAYPQVYFEADGKTPRQPAEKEKRVQEQSTQRCVQGFAEDRQKLLQYDRNLSAFLIFVGGGLVLASRLGRRYFV